MIILVDTNLLCRLCNSIKPPTADAIATRHAFQVLRNRGNAFAITPQNIHEFWSVATRSRGTPPTGANGLGMTVMQANAWVSYFLRNFKLLGDTDQSLALWRELVSTHGVTGHKCHDVRLVAAMKVHGIASILTFNVDDFQRFPYITILDPRTIS